MQMSRNGHHSHLLNTPLVTLWNNRIISDYQVDYSSGGLCHGDHFSWIVAVYMPYTSITFVQCWTNVEDVVLMLYKCHRNVFCLLGIRACVMAVRYIFTLNKDLIM